MRAKLDENVPIEATELLRAAGWSCDTVHDEGLAGADDPKIGAVWQEEGRVLFTSIWTLPTSGPIRPMSTLVSWCFDRPSPVDGTCFRWWPGFFLFWLRTGSTISCGSLSRIAFVYGGQTNQLSNSACTRRRCASRERRW